jgi:hypothetical protein
MTLNIKTKISAFLVGITLLFGIFSTCQISLAAIDKQVEISGYMSSSDGNEIDNGEYSIRFAIYSDPESNGIIWEESQNIKIVNGIFSASMGTVNSFPNNLNFDDADYYLGIKIGSDSEMKPRKKMGAVPLAINSMYLDGEKIGKKEGDILQLGKNGKIDIDQLPTGNGNNDLILGNDNRLHDQNTDTETDSETFDIGSGTSLSGNNFDFSVSSATNKPSLRYNGTSGVWQFSNNGVSFQNLSSVDITLEGDSGDSQGISGQSTLSILGGTNISTEASEADSITINLNDTLTGTTWNGNVIETTYGGTGLSSYTAGDLLYYSSGNSLSKLGIGLNGQVLAISGGELAWASTAASTPHDLLSVQHSDSIISIPAQGDVLYYNGAGWTKLAAGASGQYLETRGASANPRWSSVASHDLVTLTNSPATYDYLTISGQAITLAQINLTTDVAGVLPVGNIASTVMLEGENISLLNNNSGFITSDSADALINKSGSNSMWTNDEGYLTNYIETDPIFITSEAANVTAGDITNLGNLSGINTGDQDLSGYATLANPTFTGDVNFPGSGIWNSSGYVGIGDTTPASLFTVGDGDDFQVNSSGYLVNNLIHIGDAGTVSYADGDGDLYVEDELEVDGAAYFNSSVNIYAYLNILDNSIQSFGSGDDVRMQFDTGQTNNSLLIGVGVGTSGQSGNIIFIENGDIDVDFGHAISSNPTLYIQSADATSTSDYLKFWHDQTDGNIDVGSGSLNLMTGGIAALTIDSTGLVSVNDIELGAFNFAEDSGAVSWVDMSISGTQVAGTVESYTAQLDGNALLTIYGEADGSGGLQNEGVGIGDTTPSYIFTVDHNRDGANYAYVNDSNAWTSGSADYAEYFWTESEKLESGEVVCVDITKENAIKRCTRASDPDVMGIVSTSPAVLGNAPGEEHRENNPNYAVIGMLGQVPAKVSAENGEIASGDSLTSASKAGYVMKANPGDSTVGVALENLKKGEGVINVLISRKNKSLTVEEVEAQVSDRIAEMEVEDQVNALLADAMTALNVENRLALLEAQSLDSQAVLAEIESQMNLIRDENILQFIADMNENFASFSDISEDIEKMKTTGLLDGKLTIEETETGALTIKVIDEESPTIGSTVILPVQEQSDLSNESDESSSVNDGKSIFVSTKAVSESGKVFTSFESNPGSSSWVEKVQDEETGEFVGFKIILANEVSEEVKVNWWIVESK